MYNKTNWVDNSAPYINADALNKIENGIYDNSETIVFSARNSYGTKSITSGVATILPLNTVYLRSTIGIFTGSDTNPFFTAPKTGYYRLSVTYTWNNNLTARHSNIMWKNLTPNKQITGKYYCYDSKTSTSTSYEAHHSETILYVEVGTILQVTLTQTGESDMNIRTDMTLVSGHYIGA